MDINLLSSKPNWWPVRIVTAISIATLVIGFPVALVWANGEYGRLSESALEKGREPGLPELLTSIVMFVWYLVSSCFWAALMLVLARLFNKIDEIVWLKASEADRIEIYRKRRKTNPPVDNG